MATVKVKFRASSVEMKEGSLYYQVIHNRLVRQVHTGYRLFPSEWDAGISEVVVASGTEEGRRNYLLSMKTAIADDLSGSEASSHGSNVPTRDIPPTRWWKCSPLRPTVAVSFPLHDNSYRN